MKRAILCIAFVLFTIVGANAYAASTATYNDSTDTVSVAGESNVKTVIITDTDGEVADANIYYMDQASSDSAIDAALGFAMKEDAHQGSYYMTLMRNDSTTEKINFTLTNKINLADYQMTQLSQTNAVADKFSAVFVTTSEVDLSAYNMVKFGYTENGETKYVGCPLDYVKSSALYLGDKVEEASEAFIGINLNDIPSGCTNISMWLSSDTFVEGGDSE